MHTHNLLSLPPGTPQSGYVRLSPAGEVVLVIMVLILAVGICTGLQLAVETITGATRWLVRLLRRRMPKETDHE